MSSCSDQGGWSQGRGLQEEEALEMERGDCWELCLPRAGGGREVPGAHASKPCVQALVFPPTPSGTITRPLKVGHITVCCRDMERNRYQLGHQSCWCLVSRPKPMAAQVQTSHKDSFMWQRILNGPHPHNKRSALLSGNGMRN